METGSYKLAQSDRAFGLTLMTEDTVDIKYYTLTLTLYNRVYWLEYGKKVNEAT